MRRIFKQIRRLFECVLLLVALILIPPLPRGAILALACVLGDLGRWCGVSLRRVARANLDVAFGDTRSPAEKDAILRQSYRQFALVLLDLFWFVMFTRRRLERLVTFDDSIRHYNTASPGLVVTGHFGNWEVMGLSTVLLGEPIVSVARPIKNPLAEKLMAWFRRRTGQGIEQRTGAVKALLKVLRRGGRTAVLLDQNTLPAEGGVFVDFFGLPVPASRAAAILARHTGAAILVSYSVVEPGGRYRIFVQPPLRVEGEDDTALTQTIIGRLEGLIREYPEQWLWMYKRWKYVPAGAPRERYPFYAKAAPAESSQVEGCKSQVAERRGKKG